MPDITVKPENLVHRPLWFHKRHLLQTATGYGRNLKTEFMYLYNNRLHRIYFCCFSNTGTLYVKTKNGDKTIDIEQ